MGKIDYQKKVNCPFCELELSVDSVRYHVSGEKRTYWECPKCFVSIMYRGKPA